MATRNRKRAAALTAAAATAAAAAAAGYYFYGSKDAAKHRAAAARWAQDLRKDVERELARAKRIDRAAVLRAVDDAVRAYETARRIGAKDLERAARELKRNWQALVRESAAQRPPAKNARAKTRARRRTR